MTVVTILQDRPVCHGTGRRGEQASRFGLAVRICEWCGGRGKLWRIDNAAWRTGYAGSVPTRWPVWEGDTTSSRGRRHASSEGEPR